MIFHQEKKTSWQPLFSSSTHIHEKTTTTNKNNKTKQQNKQQQQQRKQVLLLLEWWCQDPFSAYSFVEVILKC